MLAPHGFSRHEAARRQRDAFEPDCQRTFRNRLLGLLEGLCCVVERVLDVGYVAVGRRDKLLLLRRLRERGIGFLLSLAGRSEDPGTFKRVASAKSLYHWHADANQEY